MEQDEQGDRQASGVHVLASTLPPPEDFWRLVPNRPSVMGFSLR